MRQIIKNRDHRPAEEKSGDLTGTPQRDLHGPGKNAKNLADENAALRAQLAELSQVSTSQHYTEASYQSIFENATEGKFQCLPDGRFLKINAALARILGYENPDEFLRRDAPRKNQFFLDFNAREEYESLLEEQGEIVGYEYQIERRDHVSLWVSENARIVKGTDGAVRHLEGTIQDITERKHVENMVQENEQRLRRQNRTLVRLTRRRSVNHENLDKDLEEIARAASHTLGLERVAIWLFNDDHSQLRCQCLYQTSYDEVTRGAVMLGDDYPVYFGALRQERILSAPCAMTDPRLTELQEQYLNPHGIQSVLAAPIKGGETLAGFVFMEHIGHPRIWTLDEQNFCGSIADIVSLDLESAERKRVEEALRVTDERFQILVRATNESIWDWDFATDQVWWNEGIKTLFGFRAEEVGGDSEWRFANIHPEDRERIENEINYIIDEGGQIWSGEYRYRRANGSYAHVMDRGFILHDRLGKPIRMIGSIMDITDRKLAEQSLKEERAQLAKRVEERTAELSAANAALAEASKLKDEFLASMSHELRTPLNAILGMSEALLEKIHGELNDRQARFIGNIAESGRHLLDLINDILDLSKIEVGKLELQLDQVDIDPVCQASLRMVKEAAMRKQIPIQLEIQEGLPRVHADERRVKQILVNLLSNAVKFTPENGQVGLKVLSGPPYQAVEFHVWDSGIGISKENLNRLFQPFTQLDSRLSRQYNGTGLGLALVRRMVEMHGGTVKVQSSPGKGSCFSFQLPVDSCSPGDPDALESHAAEFYPDGASPAAETREPAAAIPATAAEEGALVLVAEDNEINIESLTSYLMMKGFRIQVARHGKEAVQLAIQQTPDVILMDVQMPEMDGLEATRILRSHAQTGKTPIIALTALAMPGDRERCLSAGANLYLSKPVNLKNLVQTINQLLHKAAAKEPQA